MLRTYKYRIYPNQKQRELLAKHFGACRWIYNWGLEEKLRIYQNKGIQVSRYELSKKLPLLKEIHPWLEDISAQSLQQVLVNLETSFKNFFRHNHGFPNFKAKKNSRNSCRFPQNNKVSFDENYIKTYKLKKIKTVFDRNFDGNVKSVTLSQDKSGKYHATVLVEDSKEKEPTQEYTRDTSIGVDLGLISFATLSTGEKINNPKFFRRELEELKKEHRKLSRKKIDGKNRNKQRIKLAKKYEKVRTKRTDFLHKLSTRLIRENQAIILEDLNIDGLKRNKYMSKAIFDASWGEFVRQLQYKADWYGKTVIKIGRFEPSSRLCTCGIINKELTLKDRIWTCKHCGVTHDRDILAANNIKKIGWGTSEFTPVETECSKASHRSRNKQLVPLGSASF